MELPKIRNEDLPEELKNILGGDDAEFDPIVDPTDILDIPDTSLSDLISREKLAKALKETRRKVREIKSKVSE